VKPPRVAPEQIRRGWAKKPKRASSEAKPAIKDEVQPEISQQKPEVKAEAKRKTSPPRQEKVVKKQKRDAEQLPDERSLAIAKSFVKDYGPQFLQNYRLWQRNSSFDLDQVRTNPLHWTNWDVYEYIERALNSVDIARSIFEQDIDGRALLMLGRNELDKYLKLKVGPAVKLYSLIVNLRIAVVCKFETNTTGLAINADAATQRRKRRRSHFLLRNRSSPRTMATRWSTMGSSPRAGTMRTWCWTATTSLASSQAVW